MVTRSFFHLPAFFRKHAASVLAGSFLLGHLLGIWFSGSACDALFSTMRAAVSSRVSIIGLLSSVVLPFLVSACAVYAGRPVLLIPIAFVKAFLFSYIGYGLWTAWGSAGWLITGLMLSGGLLSMPVLYWYWLRAICGARFQIALFGVLLGVLIAIGILDYHLILPFLAEIITF